MSAFGLFQEAETVRVLLVRASSDRLGTFGAAGVCPQTLYLAVWLDAEGLRIGVE